MIKVAVLKNWDNRYLSSGGWKGIISMDAANLLQPLSGLLLLSHWYLISLSCDHSGLKMKFWPKLPLHAVGGKSFSRYHLSRVFAALKAEGSWSLESTFWRNRFGGFVCSVFRLGACSKMPLWNFSATLRIIDTILNQLFCLGWIESPK